LIPASISPIRKPRLRQAPVPRDAGAEPLWTVAEVAPFLKVSRSFVYQACAAKTMPHVRVGAALRFDPVTLRA
jgi:excisionase family DNA binding protein